MFGLATLDSLNIRRQFFAALSAAEAGSFWSQIAMEVGSTRASEEYKWLGAAPAMREWIGGRQGKKPSVQGITISNKPFEASFEIPVEDLDRDATGQINVRVQDLATRAALHPDSLLSDLINVSETALCYDGQAFIDTDHVTGDSGTQTNDLTTTEVPASNVTTTTRMTAVEAADVIYQTIAHMFTFKDDAGQPINQNARRFAVMASPGHMAGIGAALSAQFLTAGVTNPLLASAFQVVPIINPRLTLTTKIFVFRIDGAMKPFIYQTEKAPDLFVFDRNSEYARDTRHVKAGVDVRRNVGFGLWEHAAMVTLT